MSTLSVPLTDGQRKAIKHYVNLGVAANEAEFARQALQRYTDDLAVKMVLQAKDEPSLKGDLDGLAAKL